jgi:hypothetical protein
MTMKQLDRLLFEQGNQCFFCRKPLKPIDASVEHLVASANGGTNGEENCVACCKKLNALLGSKSLKEKVQIVLNQRGSFRCPEDLERDRAASVAKAMPPDVTSATKSAPQAPAAGSPKPTPQAQPQAKQQPQQQTTPRSVPQAQFPAAAPQSPKQLLVDTGTNRGSAQRIAASQPSIGPARDVRCWTCKHNFIGSPSKGGYRCPHCDNVFLY